MKISVLTQSKSELAADRADRRVALDRIGVLTFEAVFLMYDGLTVKRARKRAAALRQRANAVWNQFCGKVLGRASDKLRAMVASLEARQGIVVPYGAQINMYEAQKTLIIRQGHANDGPIVFWPSLLPKLRF